jgi:NADH:ubiquinone oxidoreductase subunit 4 (subunit M)
LIIVMGVYPQPFLDRINPSAERQIAKVVSERAAVAEHAPVSNEFQEQN